jgi:hypothetical protein
MATVDQEPRSVYVPPAADAATALLRRPLFSAVRWGAIIAGVAAGISMQLVLTLLGIATGLSATDVNASNTGTAIGTMLWAGISMLIASFIGGYVAARMSGLKRKADGVLHGLVSWAVTTLLFVSLATSAGSSLLGGIFHTMGPSLMQGANTPGSPLSSLVSKNGAHLDANVLSGLQQDIQAGNREDAIRRLASAGVDSNRAASVVDQALIVSGKSESASPEARDTANRAVSNAGATAWTLFAAVALALVIAIAGGVVGAAGSRRTTWAGSSMAARTA